MKLQGLKEISWSTSGIEWTNLAATRRKEGINFHEGPANWKGSLIWLRSFDGGWTNMKWAIEMIERNDLADGHCETHRRKLMDLNP